MIRNSSETRAKKKTQKREAEMRQEDEDEDRYVRLKVRSIRESDG